MPFQKGVAGCPTGRPKGKKKKPVKPLLERLLERALLSIEAKLNSGSPEIKREFFTDIIKLIPATNINRSRKMEVIEPGI